MPNTIDDVTQLQSHHRILLTGAAGGLGKVLRERLKRNCAVLRLSDIAPLGPALDAEEIVQADLAELDQVRQAVAGCDAIVHLGGISVDAPFADILQANILGTHNLYRAAQENGVKRIVFASSNHVIGFYSQCETITADHPPRPDSNYGLSKAFGENLARLYYDRYGIETACLRIGSSFPEPKDRRMLATWLSYDDLHRLVMASLTTPALGFTVIFGASDNPVTWWDNARAKHVGYRPQDSSAPFRRAVYERTSAPDPAQSFQGGAFVQGEPF